MMELRWYVPPPKEIGGGYIISPTPVLQYKGELKDSDQWFDVPSYKASLFESEGHRKEI